MTRINRIPIMGAIALTLSLCISAALPATADDPGSHSTKPLGPRAEGRRLLATLPPIQQGAAKESYFELTMHGETTGYVITSLAPVVYEKENRYAYNDLCIIQGPTGASTQMNTSGVLDQFFMPLTITWETTNRLPNRIHSITKETLTTTAETVTLRSGDGKDIQTLSVPRPTGPLIHPIGRLFTMLKPQAGQFYILREFDTEAKSFAWKSYRVTRKDDGRLRISVGDAKGLNEEAYYILDADGEVAQHGAAGMPFLFKRCTKERVEAIKKELADKPKVKPDSAKRQTATKPAR